MVREDMETVASISGVTSVVEGFAIMRDAMMQPGASLGALTAQMKTLGESTYAVRRGTMLMRTEMRNSMAAMLEGARFMRDIGAIGRNVVSMWQAYTLAQTRVSDAARDLRSAQSDVVVINEALNRAVRAGDMEQQLDLTLKLSRAQDEVTRASQDVSKAQQDNIIGYAGIIMQTGDIIARAPMMYIHYSMVTKLLFAKTGAMAADTLATGANTVAAGANVLTDAWGTDVKAAAALVQGRKTAALILDTTVTGTNTLAQAASTTGIWAWVAARTAQLALIPGWGWAVLAGAGVVAGAYLASQGGGGGAKSTDNSITIYGGVSVNAEDAEGVVDSLRRRGYG